MRKTDRLVSREHVKISRKIYINVLLPVSQMSWASLTLKMLPQVIGMIWSIPYQEDASTGRGGVDGEGESHNRGSDTLIQNTFAWGVVINVVENEKGLVVPSVENRASQDRQHDVCRATVHRNVRVCCQRRKDGRPGLQIYISECYIQTVVMPQSSWKMYWFIGGEHGKY